MRILEWIQAVLGLFAIGSGAIVLRGVLGVGLSGHRVVRFLECSLIASLAGLLPLTRHLSPIQGICMMSVYCAGAVILVWRKFHLAGLWRPVFAFLIVAALYLNVVFVSIRFLNPSPLSSMAATGAGLRFQIAQFVFASVFAVLGVMSVRHARRTH